MEKPVKQSKKGEKLGQSKPALKAPTQKEPTQKEKNPKTTKKPKKKKSKKRKAGLHIFLFSLKWVVIAASLIAAGAFGLVVGYSFLGDGESSQVFNIELWKHIYNLVFSP